MTDPVTRLNSALEGRYRIERELGEGGMANVYLAEDLRHNRKVALKVLKPELAAVVGAERFLAEIETTANLQHPHILPLFDSGEADSFLFYVMPYVEGETLRDRLARERQLPVDEAVRIGRDLAEALDYAHRRDVIHRDIKPANILMHEGRPLIADFGIALAVGSAGGARLTETGLSLGTPFYMSPEQATGDQSVGPASDIYAIGCVLFEMLVGEPPYPGATAQAVLGKIIAGGPVSATEHRATIPANVDAAVRKALEKLPADRFATAKDFGEALADPAFRHGVGSRVASEDARSWKRAAAAFAALFVMATGAAVWSMATATAPPAAPVERYDAPFPGAAIPTFLGAGAFSLAPDGSFLVYRDTGQDGSGNHLWIRRWNDLVPQPLQGTEGGAVPRVSPDGEEIAFIQGGIRVLSLRGGPIRTLELDGAAPPAWGLDGRVYVGIGPTIWGAPATGGAPDTVASFAEGSGYVVSDIVDEALLALVFGGVAGEDAEIRGLSLETGETTPLTFGAWPRYAASGHLLYLSDDGTLMGAPFDPGRVELTGPAVGLIEGVGAYSISRTGKLFYALGSSGNLNAREFVWVSRDGAARPVDPDWTFAAGPDANTGWSLSPDGSRLAVRILGDDGYDIWIKELDEGPLSRLTFDAAHDRMPRWSPDGRAVTFLSTRDGSLAIWSKPADGTGQAELLYAHDSNLAQGFWTPDGQWLIGRTAGTGGVAGRRGIIAVPADSRDQAVPLLEAEYDEAAPAVSPDGRWLAYASVETGRYEVFVRPFPDVDAGKWQVSTDGASEPLWAHSGNELFYVASSGEMMSARVDTSDGFRVLAREPLFDIPPGFVGADPQSDFVVGLIDVTLDDQTFLMARPAGTEEDEGPATGQAVLVVNFFTELAERVPSGR